MNTTVLTKYDVNFSSSDRDMLFDKSPLNFNVWFNGERSKSNIYKSFKNIKSVQLEHVTFPSYIQLNKERINESNEYYNDINNIINNDVEINNQYTYNGNTFEICNIIEKDGITYINFTINMDTLSSYEWIKNGDNISLYKYVPITIDSVSNRIHYMSISPCDNVQIYSTKHNNFFRYMFPKMKTGSDLYLYTRKSKISYTSNNLLNMNRIIVKIMNTTGEPITIDNLDFLYSSHNDFILDYTSPQHYIRHPLNAKYQIDIFLKVECYEKSINHK